MDIGHNWIPEDRSKHDNLSINRSVGQSNFLQLCGINDDHAASVSVADVFFWIHTSRKRKESVCCGLARPNTVRDFRSTAPRAVLRPRNPRYAERSAYFSNLPLLDYSIIVRSLVLASGHLQGPNRNRAHPQNRSVTRFTLRCFTSTMAEQNRETSRNIPPSCFLTSEKYIPNVLALAYLRAVPRKYLSTICSNTVEA